MKNQIIKIIFMVGLTPIICFGQATLFGNEITWIASGNTLGAFTRNSNAPTWSRISTPQPFVRLTSFNTSSTFLETTNAINTTGYGNIVVQFKEWISSGFPNNRIKVMISTNGGTNWTDTGFNSVATTNQPSNANAIISLSGMSNIADLKVRISCSGANYSGSANYNIDDFAVLGTALPTSYYNLPDQDLSSTDSWGINPDGSGGHPSNFQDDNQTFNVFNGSTASIQFDWNIEGNGSKVVIGDGTNPIIFTLPDGLTLSVGQLDVSSNATFTYASSTQLPQLGTLATNSTFVYQYDTDVSIVPATYYNLKLEGLGNKLFDGSSSYVVSNNFDVNGQYGNVSLYASSLTLQGSILGTPVFSGTNQSQLIINKTGGGTAGGISFDPASSIYALQITNGTLTLASDVPFDGATVPSLSIGALGILDAGTFVCKGSASTGGTASIIGTLRSSNVNGLFGGSNTTFDNAFTTPSFNSGTIELNASSGSQAVPVLNSGNRYRNLTLSGGATKTFNSSVYNITGDFSQSGGAISLGSGTTFLYDGTGNQSLPALNYTTVTFGGAGNKSLGTDDSTRITVGMVVNGSAVVVTGGRLVLKAASASQTAYLLDNTSGNGVSGNVTVERMVPSGRPGTPSVNGLPIFISSPVSGSLSMIQATNRNFFSYNPTITTTNRFINVNVSNTVIPGLGYLVRRFGGFVFRYYGTVHTGDITQNLLFGVDNFNLIGNPYPSAITWDATNLTLTNLASSNQYRIYNGSAYEIRNVGTTIPMGQGMFVEAASAGASVTFKNQSRLAASSTLTRTVNPNENRVEIWINRSLTQKDMSVLWGQENADSKIYINRYDGRKIMPTNAAFPAVFFTKESLNLDLFTYGLQENVVSVPLNVRIPKDSIYSIQFNGLNNLNPSTGIILIDSLLNTSQNLRISDTYTFQATTATGKRFRVLINQVVTSEDNSSNIKKSDVWLFTNQKIVSIFAPENVDAIRINDMAGNVVYDQLTNALQTDVNLQFQPEGIYIVSISFQGRLIHKKIILSN